MSKYNKNRTNTIQEKYKRFTKKNGKKNCFKKNYFKNKMRKKNSTVVPKKMLRIFVYTYNDTCRVQHKISNDTKKKENNKIK